MRYVAALVLLGVLGEPALAAALSSALCASLQQQQQLGLVKQLFQRVDLVPSS